MKPDTAIQPADGQRMLESQVNRLTATAKMWEALLGAVPAGIVLLDGGGRVAALNNAWRRLFNFGPTDGLNPGDLYAEGCRCAGLLGAAEADAVAAGIAQVIAGDSDSFTIELKVAPADPERWHAVQVVPLDRAAYDGAVVQHTDISDAVRSRIAVETLNCDLEAQKATLQEANHELDSFAYAVSHDLRAPLRAMSGFSQALIEDCGEQLDGQARSYLEQIEVASARMGELIDGILVLSRCTRGEIRRDHIDLSAMATRLLNEHKKAEPARHVVFTVEPGLSCCGDGRMVDVVMRNLLDNAWKYSAKTETATIAVYSEVGADEDFICVSDNGAGFDMRHAGKLFQPFQRLHRQEEFQGLGIGLATVQRIINRHGGRITATGSPGHGATFRFTLPDRASDPPEEP
jgi:signal transduction histidine kinase